MQCYRNYRNSEVEAKLMPHTFWPKRKWWSLDGPGPNHAQNVDVRVLECSCLFQQRTASNWKKRRNTGVAVPARQFRGANAVSCKSGWNTGMKCLCDCKECHRILRDSSTGGRGFVTIWKCSEEMHTSLFAAKKCSDLDEKIFTRKTNSNTQKHRCVFLH